MTPPVPMSAEVETLAIVTATTGVKETLELKAPFSASVSVVLEVVALRPRL